MEVLGPDGHGGWVEQVSVATLASVAGAIYASYEYGPECDPDDVVSGVDYIRLCGMDDHMGDCVLAERQGPVTCGRCVHDEFMHMARTAIRAYLETTR
jgi:hypothetical protein